MNDLTDRELVRVRLKFIDVIKSFFMNEPDAEKMSRWRGFFTALSGKQVNPNLDRAVEEICRQVNTKKLEVLKSEYYKLFVDPYDPDRIQLDASYHIDGRSYGMTLANFRGFLQERNLEKEAEFTDSEDSLMVMLDALGTFIEQEQSGVEIARISQATMIEQYLEPFIKLLSDVFSANETADFYKSCIRFLTGYLDLEKALTVNS